jgi:spore coat polysaccharide biosynthesis predicted glycosyltransferase SpsG
MPTSNLHVLFVVAAGPSIGFGHLVRAGRLVRQLGVAPVMVLRGKSEAVQVALSMGWTVHRGSPAQLLPTLPDLLVVDDPSARETRRWVEAARREGVPVATLHDGGWRTSDADLVIDGSFMAASAPAGSDRALGPSFAVLDDRVREWRSRHHVRAHRHVLIALGGGRHVRRAGVHIARELSALDPHATIDLAAGFIVGNTPLPPLPPRCRWIARRRGLADALALASVAVVAGGVTLYEACALGTPVVAVPVVPAQRTAIRAAARAGAAVPATLDSAARAVTALLDHPRVANAMGRRAHRLVDAEGARRLATALRALVARQSSKGVARAA